MSGISQKLQNSLIIVIIICLMLRCYATTVNVGDNLSESSSEETDKLTPFVSGVKSYAPVITAEQQHIAEKSFEDKELQFELEDRNKFEMRRDSDIGSGSEDITLTPSNLLQDETPYSVTPSNLQGLLDVLVSNIQIATSSSCKRGWSQLFNSTDSLRINNGEKALDSFGKVGAGYLQGNTFALGDYDECFSLSDSQYCLTDLIVLTPLEARYILYGLCLPQSCSEHDIYSLVNFTNSQLEAKGVAFQIQITNCESETKLPHNAGSIVVIIIWCLFVAMVVTATGVHFISKTLKYEKDKSSAHTKQSKIVVMDTEVVTRPIRKKKKKLSETLLSFLFAFSVYETIPKIFAIKKQPPCAITCLHGIRVITITWVILGHTNLWSLFFISNPQSYLRNQASKFAYRAIPGGEFSVDSFFLMSGLLTTYLSLRYMARKQRGCKFPFLIYFLHRFLRITPIYAFVLFSYWFLTVHLANGPIWRRIIGPESNFYESCNQYWWTNLLYINNIYPRHHLNICMPWSWFLANDMQFYILAPLIIIPLYYLYPLGLSLIAVLLPINFAIIGGISGGYDISVNVAKIEELSMAYTQNELAKHNLTDDIYTKPWTRVGPYLIGILIGFILYKQIRPNFSRRRYTQIFYMSLWIIASILCFMTVYGLSGRFGGGDFNRSEDIAYLMFSRTAWAIAVAIIVYVCHNGHGWIINNFLSMKVWIPLSRLTYTTYLIHGIVLFILIYTNQGPFHAYEVTLTVYSTTAIIASFTTAAIIASLVEFPLSNVEELIFKMIGFGKRDSTRQSTIRSEDCAIKLNEGFDEGTDGSRTVREGVGMKQGGDQDGEEVGRVARGDEDGVCVVNKNVWFEEEMEERIKEKGKIDMEEKEDGQEKEDNEEGRETVREEGEKECDDVCETEGGEGMLEMASEERRLDFFEPDKTTETLSQEGSE